jgi:hypothetical protein
MNPTEPEQRAEHLPVPGAPQFNSMPLGGMAANMAPDNPNAPSVPAVSEIAPVGSPEQLSNPETQSGPAQGIPTVAAPTVPVVQPPVVVPSTTVPSDDSATTSNPATAADEDLIEKEWVTKAKQILAKTKNDPYEQAKQVAALMRDYVKKRYGREVGKAPDD